MVLSRNWLPAILVAGALSALPATAETVKASAWVGRVVVTTDGELLGRIEDFALDIEQQQIKFVVVSIGSFLVDNNLIAVHPDALGKSDDGEYLVVYTDSLDGAARFGANNWPVTADVLASAERQAVQVDASAVEDDLAEFTGDGVATISDGRRTATMKAGERNAQIETSAGVAPAAPPAEVQPKRFQEAGVGEPIVSDSEFERLDDNGDGYLSRAEIGARLESNIRYQDFDLDGNDGIDPFEFQVLKNRG